MPISHSPIVSPKPMAPVLASREPDAELGPKTTASTAQGSLWPPAGWQSVGLPVGPKLVPPQTRPAPRVTLLFGGSFNPPHRGHTWMVDQAAQTLGRHDVWVMPSFVHAEKADLAPFETRVAMCRAQFREASVPVEVQDLERLSPATGETADVLQWLQAKMPDRQFVLLFGGDLADRLEHWSCWPTLKNLVPIFVQPRGPMFHHEAEAAAGLHPSTWSSTLVRAQLRRGLSIDTWVAPGVAEIVAREQLYVARADPAAVRAA